MRNRAGELIEIEIQTRQKWQFGHISPRHRATQTAIDQRSKKINENNEVCKMMRYLTYKTVMLVPEKLGNVPRNGWSLIALFTHIDESTNAYTIQKRKIFLYFFSFQKKKKSHAQCGESSEKVEMRRDGARQPRSMSAIARDYAKSQKSLW